MQNIPRRFITTSRCVRSYQDACTIDQGVLALLYQDVYDQSYQDACTLYQDALGTIFQDA